MKAIKILNQIEGNAAVQHLVATGWPQAAARTAVRRFMRGRRIGPNTRTAVLTAIRWASSKVAAGVRFTNPQGCATCRKYPRGRGTWVRCRSCGRRFRSAFRHRTAVAMTRRASRAIALRRSTRYNKRMAPKKRSTRGRRWMTNAEVDAAVRENKDRLRRGGPGLKFKSVDAAFRFLDRSHAPRS